MFPVRADVPCGNSTGSSCNVGVSGVPAVGVLVRRWPAGHGLSWTQQSTGNENGIAEEYDSNHAKSVYLIYGPTAASSATSTASQRGIQTLLVEETRLRSFIRSPTWGIIGSWMEVRHLSSNSTPEVDKNGRTDETGKHHHHHHGREELIKNSQEARTKCGGSTEVQRLSFVCFTSEVCCPYPPCNIQNLGAVPP